MVGVPKRPDFIHHQKSRFISEMREIVFGVEDGMVSTLGALVGIAIGSHEQFIVILSGMVIVSVESISMGIGTYLSHKSARGIIERKLYEESSEIKKYPEEEKQELIDMYLKDGWPRDIAQDVADIMIKDEKLLLKEMAYRELKIIPEIKSYSIRKGIFMFFSYVLGGSLPVLPYFFLSVGAGLRVSIFITLLGLFILGVITTKFTKRIWWKVGLEFLTLAGLAALVGYFIGNLGSKII